MLKSTRWLALEISTHTNCENIAVYCTYTSIWTGNQVRLVKYGKSSHYCFTKSYSVCHPKTVATLFNIAMFFHRDFDHVFKIHLMSYINMIIYIYFLIFIVMVFSSWEFLIAITEREPDLNISGLPLTMQNIIERNVEELSQSNAYREPLSLQ